MKYLKKNVKYIKFFIFALHFLTNNFLMNKFLITLILAAAIVYGCIGQTLNNKDISDMEVPDIALPTPQGNIVKLSSTIGSVVLLDFWAAWCTPCRMENPNLVKVYNKYHEKGFQIYQVSLDRTKEAWIRGINEDKLDKWIHVSDLKYWNSSVVGQYKIQYIPYNLLLDQNGRVIATNLRGNALERKLAEIFPQ
jgi:thiol-disulfide isomerase/thioredoxin